MLLKNELKDFNYKSESLYLMVDIIKHLNRYFNLFAFDKNMVVGFDRSNQLAVERISRICQYVYQNYAGNNTLQDLSDMEHLSSYYISHLIKDFTGMNFREFLCFARVEMSEARLLGSDHKISQIAGEVGFSTTAYYRKYFTKDYLMGPNSFRLLDELISGAPSAAHFFRTLDLGCGYALTSMFIANETDAKSVFAFDLKGYRFYTRFVAV